MPDATFHFPPNFRWGVATAAHQIEGNNTNNQWWAWEQQPGRIEQGGKSGLACDAWRHPEVDFDHAAAMGLNAMRLSVEWSRIEVAPGRIDTAALDRYREMLKGLRERGIEPLVTLHHFSDPMWLADEGGWLNVNVIQYFTRYVEQVVRALGEFTNLWCTINEPNVYAYMGYMSGVFPPGKQDSRMAFAVIRSMLQAHAAAYRRIHRVQENAQVGLAHNLRFFDPARPRNLLDRLAAWVRDMGFNQTTLKPVWNGWWAPPMGFGPALTLRRTLDWIGLNYYTRDLVKFDRAAKADFYAQTTHDPKAEPLDGDYGELYPQGMSRALKQLARMNIPIYVTENGIPDADDDQRPRALLLHLRELWRALQDNVPVQGYYHWTLTDNFEWAEGWTLPFGLIEFDPQTQARTPRPSADLYAAIAQGNAITPELLDAYAPELRKVLLPE